MPILHPSFLYPDSTEPPKRPLPLEARKIHFCSSILLSILPGVSNHLHEAQKVGAWTVRNPNEIGTPIPRTYASRHDMLLEGQRAHTALQREVELYVQTLVCEGGKLEGWRPATENYRGKFHCFDIVFLRPKDSGCTDNVRVAEATPAPVMWRWGPQREVGRVLPEMRRWRTQQRGLEAPETAPARDMSLDNQSQMGDTTSDRDPNYVPPSMEDRVREVKSLRGALHRMRRETETQATMRQMRRFAVVQNELENERVMRDSTGRRVVRGFSLWSSKVGDLREYL